MVGSTSVLCQPHLISRKLGTARLPMLMKALSQLQPGGEYRGWTSQPSSHMEISKNRRAQQQDSLPPSGWLHSCSVHNQSLPARAHHWIGVDACRGLRPSAVSPHAIVARKHHQWTSQRGIASQHPMPLAKKEAACGLMLNAQTDHCRCCIMMTSNGW